MELYNLQQAIEKVKSELFADPLAYAVFSTYDVDTLEEPIYVVFKSHFDKGTNSQTIGVSVQAGYGIGIYDVTLGFNMLPCLKFVELATDFNTYYKYKILIKKDEVSNG